ncbi:MAG TPA: iron-sulfur cluster assembly protein [Actinomycetota bacterium]|nr:iron-sulfur cluster assembly protein [Actinomycetota bacterium]
MTRAEAVTESEVLDALRGVLDPELDESLVDLGFVTSVAVTGGEVRVGLRLPTYWCSPNFSWLMASDARQAVLALPGVDGVTVALEDHHAGEEISSGVSGGRTFEETFGEQATEGLDDLRRLFRRKAFVVRQERLLRSLGQGLAAGLTVGDLPDTVETHAYLAVREEIGLDCTPTAPAITDPTGRAVEDVEGHLRRIGLMRVSMEGNAMLCRALLEARYGSASGKEGVAS